MNELINQQSLYRTAHPPLKIEIFFQDVTDKRNFKLVKSTMTRATETANIILKHLPQDIQQSSCNLIREGAPCPPEPPISHWDPEPQVR